jgi:hypothetical protein
MTLVSAHLGFNKTYPLVSGGSLITGTDPNYYYRVFSGNGTLTVSGLPITMDIVLVGGGGGGGAVAYVNYGGGGGGGGGGVSEYMSQTVNPGTYPIVIGAGGTAGTSSVEPTRGIATSGLSYSVNGGGRGGSRTPSGFFNPESGTSTGGSGGGGSTYMNTGLGGAAPTFGFGNAGGNAGSSLSGGGGGGGAGAAGSSASSGFGQGADGGAGRTSLYTTSDTSYFGTKRFAAPLGGGGGGGTSDSTSYGITTRARYTLSSLAVDTPSAGFATCYTTNTPSVNATAYIDVSVGDSTGFVGSVLSVNPGVSFVLSTVGYPGLVSTSGPLTYTRSSASGSSDGVFGDGNGAYFTPYGTAGAGGNGFPSTGGGGGGGFSSNTSTFQGGVGASGHLLLRYTKASVGG